MDGGSITDEAMNACRTYVLGPPMELKVPNKVWKVLHLQRITQGREKRIGKLDSRNSSPYINSTKEKST